ncbi:alpha-glucoside transport system substrate-binding protein [Kribbella amoyensis]|uniref:Alpha-glucoside transport system substrate-binding protein n=1 Tax=Kribbella amoyensis TaxID=996641 RepID=A0A561BLY1_9ACTN|nr:ABC transporter substrate-binding protein [Kribbella amoyensis]TWD79812.1 alpha-glucoside transport system substrate-binding protein [Kribbella amoyensis]
MIGRRLFLGAVGAAALSGCAPDVLGLRRSVRVAVSWSGAELREFHRVLDGLGDLEFPVEVIPLGDDIPTAFGPRSTRRPDVVMLPRPGLVPQQLENLQPVPAELADRGRTRLWDELLVQEGETYGVPFKTAHKSAIWYRPSVFKQVGVEPPKVWSDWLQVNRQLSLAGIRPLALAAGDGWVLTDFLENVLLGSAPSAYRSLASSAEPRPSQEPAFAAALRLLGTLWAAPGTLAGGVDRSLVQQFPDAIVEVFGHRRAAMVLASDFAEPVVRSFAADPDDIGLFTFPSMTRGTAAPVVVGGDVMVLPRPASEDAQKLVRRLAVPAAADPWIATGGFLADGRTTGYSPELTRLAEQLVAPGRSLQFDLSDRLYQLDDGLQRVLNDFLVRVGDQGTEVVREAVDVALTELAKVES